MTRYTQGMATAKRITYADSVPPTDELHPDITEWIDRAILELEQAPGLGSIEHTEWLIRVSWASMSLREILVEFV